MEKEIINTPKKHNSYNILEILKMILIKGQGNSNLKMDQTI